MQQWLQNQITDTMESKILEQPKTQISFRIT